MFSKRIHLAFPSAFKSLTVLIVENLSNTAERIKAFGAMRYETQFFFLFIVMAPVNPHHFGLTGAYILHLPSSWWVVG